MEQIDLVKILGSKIDISTLSGAEAMCIYQALKEASKQSWDMAVDVCKNNVKLQDTKNNLEQVKEMSKDYIK